MKLKVIKIFLILVMLGISLSSYAYYGQDYDEYMVNSWQYWSGYEGNEDYKTDQQWSDVAMVRGSGTYAGYFVVIWQSDGQLGDPNMEGQDGYSGWDVMAKRYDNTGTPIDTYDVTINQTVYSHQRYGAVATNSSGQIVLAWHHPSKVMYRLWSFSEAPDTIAGAEKICNTETSCWQPSVGIADTGDFVIAWYSNFNAGSSHDIRAKLYDAAGNPLVYDSTFSGSSGNAFNVNTTDPETESYPIVDMNGYGDFIVTWQINDGGNWGVQAKKYYWTGGGIGNTLKDYGEINVNTYDPGNQTTPSSAIDESGNFVIVWQSENQYSDTSLWDVYARRYNSSAVPLDANEFLVNVLWQQNQMRPDVDMDALGNFVVLWQSSNISDGDPQWGIRGAEIKANGSFQKTEFQVNNVTALTQEFPAVAVHNVYIDPPTNYFLHWVAVWDSNYQCPVEDIYFKLYHKYIENAITLENFTAYAELSKVMLNWNTGSEIDNLGFYLVRSEDPESGYKLLNSKLIPSSGNGMSGNQYSYTDGNVSPGSIYYYWLVAVDVNGGYTIYGPVDVITYLTTK